MTARKDIFWMAFYFALGSFVILGTATLFVAASNSWMMESITRWLMVALAVSVVLGYAYQRILLRSRGG